MVIEMSDDYPQLPGADASPDEVDAFLEAVLFHYILRCEEGEPPDPDIYLARYPKFAEDLAAMIAGGVDAPFVADTPGTSTRERRRGWNLNEIGPYSVQFLAASTGSSHVYKAFHRETKTTVALKVHRRDQQVDPSEVERFRREAEILAELEFSGVVPLIDVGEDMGSLYVAMPWIKGITLLEVIDVLRGERRAGILGPILQTLEAKVAVIQQIADSLIHIHACGILHRDLKPSNIMIDSSSQAILIDFGIARKEGASALTRTGDQVQGTPRYLAPEILKGEQLSTNEQGEVYALGLTLYELLLERPAYDGTSRKKLFDSVLAGPPQNPTTVNKRIPLAVSRVVMKAIEHDPKKRYADMATFAEALRNTSDIHDEKSSVRLWKWFAIGCVILVLLLWFLIESSKK